MLQANSKLYKLNLGFQTDGRWLGNRLLANISSTYGTLTNIFAISQYA